MNSNQKSKPADNRLTNPARRIVTSLLLTYAGYVVLGIVLTLALATFFEGGALSQADSQESDEDTVESQAPVISTPEPVEDADEAEEVDIVPYRRWISLLTFILYIVSIYNIGWQYGVRDRNVVKCGYAAQNPWRGLNAALLALIPSVAMLLATWILAPAGLEIRPWFELTHYMYSWGFGSSAALYVIVLPVAPVTVHLGFRNGYRDISLRRRLIYVDPKKKKKSIR